MKNKSWLIAISIITVLMVLAVGCIKIEKAEPETKQYQPPESVSKGPEIKSFQANPAAIKPGESITLAWEVSGADKVSISPEVGPVNPTGMTNVKPLVTTTYILAAEGQAGTSEKSVTVNVDALVLKPDLVVTDMFIRESQMYFTVKNIGTAPSEGCRAYLYLDGTKIINGDTYVVPMEPGQEKTTLFGKYALENPIGPENIPTSTKLLQWEYKICADVENTVSEIEENNNCKAMISGQEFTYSFYEKAHLASWTTGAGKLVWPVPETSPGGSGFTTEGKVMEDNQAHSKIVATYPQQVPGGWISAVYSDFYTNDLRQPATRLLVMPRHCKFSADIGFTREAPASAKAKFSFTVLDQGGMPVYSREIVATRDGNLDSFNEDLSELSGVSCSMVLRVESQGSPGDDLTVWVDPRIIQKW